MEFGILRHAPELKPHFSWLFYFVDIKDIVFV